jgi:hypothetical protein
MLGGSDRQFRGIIGGILFRGGSLGLAGAAIWHVIE